MKKIILSLIILASGIFQIEAQTKFEIKDYGTFKLHSYVTADPLGDMNYIIEGKKGLVIVEPVAFLDNIKEFGEYISKLNKPVEKVIADYHAAGFSAFNHSKFVMVEGMPEFIKGDGYTGMMANFAKGFAGKIDVTEFVPTTTVAKNATENWAGVTFKFSAGPSSDFPAANILIGEKVFFTHFAPVANMHMSPLQISSREAIDANIAELEQAKTSGATTFIGGHGVAIADIDAVDFQITYLKKMKETAEQIKTADEFVLVMQMLYKDISGDENLTAIANNLYK